MISELLIVSRDVTDNKIADDIQRKAEKDAILSEDKFRQMMESMQQIVWTANPDGNLDFYNQQWFDYTGMNLEQTWGWGCRPLLYTSI